MSPEVPKPDDTPSRKRLKITAAEKIMLGKVDPHGPEATAFMELNGLKLGDEIIADVEGNDAPEIISLDENDFFVRNREATLSFTDEAVSRAEQFVEGETEITPEDTAEHQELVEEFAQPAGEIAIDEMEAEAGLPLEPFEGESDDTKAESEDLSPQSTEELRSVKADYELTSNRMREEARDTIMQSFRGLEGTAQEIDGVLASMSALREEADTVRRIISRIEGGDYADSTAATALQSVVDGLYSVRSRLNRVSPHGGTDDLQQYLGRIIEASSETKTALEQRHGAAVHYVDTFKAEHGADSVPEDVVIPDIEVSQSAYNSIVPITEELKNAVNKFDREIFDGGRQLGGIIRSIEDLIERGRRHSVDTGELRSLSGQLASLAENMPRTKIGQLVDDYSRDIQGALSRTEGV